MVCFGAMNVEASSVALPDGPSLVVANVAVTQHYYGEKHCRPF